MATVKGDPREELKMMQEQMDRLLERTRDQAIDSPADEGGWKPPVDIFEEAERLVVLMDVPGLAEDSIEIELEGPSLRVRGDRAPAQGGTGRTFHRVERSCGAFQRVFALPAMVDRDRIEAVCERGVLFITLPKLAEEV
jgi:HSP20 family protein